MVPIFFSRKMFFYLIDTVTVPCNCTSQVPYTNSRSLSSSYV